MKQEKKFNRYDDVEDVVNMFVRKCVCYNCQCKITTPFVTLIMRDFGSSNLMLDEFCSEECYINYILEFAELCKLNHAKEAQK